MGSDRIGDVAGLRIAITGAGSGIGRAAAKRLAASGAVVSLWDVDRLALESIAASIAVGAPTRIPHVQVVDVTNESAVVEAVQAFVDTAGGIDGAIINAGIQLIGQDASVDELELDIFERTMAVNVRGAFLTGKHVARALLAGNAGGSIVVTGSPTGIAGNGRGFTAYSTSKAAVHGLARVMAADLAEHGIRVNVVIPGFTPTPLVASLLADEAASARLVEAIPLGRTGTPDEIATIMQFLLSADAAYATGAIFTVDGGRTAV